MTAKSQIPASEQEVWNAANDLITQHGAVAWLYAATYYREARESGDTEKSAYWFAIAGAIAKLEDVDSTSSRSLKVLKMWAGSTEFPLVFNASINEPKVGYQIIAIELEFQPLGLRLPTRDQASPRSRLEMKQSRDGEHRQHEALSNVDQQAALPFGNSSLLPTKR